MMLHAWWVVLLFYVTTALVLGSTLAVVFMLAHCVEEADFPGLQSGTERLPAHGPYIRFKPRSTSRPPIGF